MKTARTVLEEYDCPLERRMMQQLSTDKHQHEGKACCQQKGHHFHIHRIAPNRAGQKKHFGIVS